jgi:hypothetical protein
MHRPLVATLLGCAIALAGCVTVHEHPQVESARAPGPPPWAPAHGYRAKHPQGPELRFDAGLGVYVVVGQPELYFYGEHYFRFVTAHWERCGDWRKPHWTTVDVALVPPGLVERYTTEGPGHGKGKGKARGQKKGHDEGHGPAKRWDDD